MIAPLLLLVAPMFLVAPGIFANPASTPKMLLICAGVWFLYRSEDLLRRRPAALEPALAFFGVNCLSWCFAADRWAAFAGAQKAPYYGLFEVALVLLVYIGSTEDQDPEGVDMALIIAGSVLGAFAVGQVVGHRLFIGLAMQGGRASGFRGSPVMFAASLVPCFLACWHRLRANWWSPRIGPLFGLAAILCGMVAAQAKGAVFAAAVGIWVYETKGGWRWAGVAVGSLLVSWYVGQSPYELERVELLRIAGRSFWQHPLVGWGPDNFLQALIANRTPAYTAIVHSEVLAQASAHNWIAQIAATLGLPGLWMAVWGLFTLMTTEYADSLAPAVLGAMVVQGLVNPVPTDILVTVAFLLGSRQGLGGGVMVLPDWLAPVASSAGAVLALADLTPWARGLR